MKALLQLKRSILSIVSFAFIALMGPQLHAKSELVVGYFGLAPHGFENDQGAAVEYFKLIARKLNWTVRFELLPLARMMATDRVDIVLYLGKNEEREKHFVFSERPLMQMQGAIAISSQHALNRIRNISDIKSLKIGVWSRGFKSEMMRTEGLSLTEETGAAIEER
ncbi:MAG: substrate-binding periplasmic protein, partial [Pseudobdellovibrionaceae bacterium]